MRIATAFSILALAASPSFAASPALPGYGAIDAERDIDPTALAQRFCDARVAGDMAELAPWLAPKLAGLLRQAEAEGRVVDAAYDGGIPWQTHPERPERCSVKVVNGFDDTIGVLVEITYHAADADWTDVINIERTPTSWMINNVFYETGGNLRFRLFER